MKLDMSFDGPLAPGQGERNRAYANALGLGRPRKMMDRPPLAVVGGGPSVAGHLDELKAWPGDVWIACGAFPWAVSAGLEGTFFNADVQALAAEYCAGAKRALVSTHNDPAVFAALKGAHVEVFDLYTSAEESNHGATTVTAAPILAMEIGHPNVSFFGCDSSYVGQTHAYADIPYADWLKVRVGLEEYDSSAPLLAQAICLAEAMRAAPDKFICRSGGLLAALMADPEYDVIACTRGFYMGLTVDGRPLHESQPPELWRTAG